MTVLPHPRHRSPAGGLRSSNGFTLIELLVVVMIISMLMALLLPTVQAAREASRRSVCANNVKQLALGCLQHHDQQGFYPSGGWGSCWTGDPDRGLGRNQPGSWAFSILPFIEQLPLFMMASDGNPELQTVTTTQEQGAKSTGDTPLPVFACPSRRQAISHPTPAYTTAGLTMRNSAMPATTNRSDYKINGGSVRIAWGNGPTRDGVNSLFLSGAAMAGTNGIAAQCSEVRAAHVRDGLSSTYLVGEKYLNPNNYYTGLDPVDDCSMFAGSDLDTVAWTSEDASVVQAIRPYRDTPGLLSPGFGGPHANVFIVSMADGSTHSIGYDVDLEVHRDRGSRNDRRPTPAP